MRSSATTPPRGLAPSGQARCDDRRRPDPSWLQAVSVLESQVALEELTKRYPRLWLLADRDIAFHPNISFRGPLALWCTVAPA
jgi:hypothetical protein